MSNALLSMRKGRLAHSPADMQKDALEALVKPLAGEAGPGMCLGDVSSCFPETLHNPLSKSVQDRLTPMLAEAKLPSHSHIPVPSEKPNTDRRENSEHALLPFNFSVLPEDESPNSLAPLLISPRPPAPESYISSTLLSCASQHCAINTLLFLYSSLHYSYLFGNNFLDCESLES